MTGTDTDRDGCPEDGVERPTDDRFATLRAFLCALFDRESIDAVDEFCTTSFRLHDGDDTATREALKENLRRSNSVFEKRIESIDGFSCDDRAAAHFVRTYTQRGEYLGSEPDGRAATFTATLICRFDGDLIDEMWVNNDDMGVLRQLDILEPPGADGE